MKQDTFRRELTNLTPDVPEAFHQRVEAFLEDKVNQEVNMKEASRQKLRTSRRIGSRALVFALIAVILLGSAALAASHWGIFDAFGYMLGDQPSADRAQMQTNLHQETVNGVEITIKEAAYDGRTLFLQYSYRMPEITYPLGEASEYRGERWLSEENMTLLAQKNVGWWMDAFWINGQCMDMAGGSGGQDNGSDIPGEIVRTEYWRLDNIGVALNGEVEIALPIGERQDSAYRKSLFNEETGQYTQPDKGVVTFTFDASDVLERVVSVTPNEETVTPWGTVRVSEANFTPLMTYITLSLEVNPDALAAYKAEHGEGYLDEEGNLLWSFTGMDVHQSYVDSLALVDGSGQLLFPEHSGFNGLGDTWAELLYPCIEPESMPEALWLAPVEAGAADMTLAIRVK